jgi:beta-galactosidase
VIDFNNGWRFHLGDIGGAEQTAFDDAAWRPIDLPHDWSIELGRDKDAPEGASVGYYRGGVGWYRKHFTPPPSAADGSVDVIFDGIQQDSEVWINGHYLGLQPHGYIGFVRTLTPHLHAGKENVIAVRTVNPGLNSRWYPGSGIYREVQLRVRSAVDVATWGLRVSTVWIQPDKAQLQLRAEVRNDRPTSQRVDLRLAVRKADVPSQTFELGTVILAPASVENVGQLFTLTAPQLWSPDSPTLYTAELTVLQDGKIVGSETQTFGVRQVTVSAADGLRLNGQPIKLKGGCLHHDNGLIGAAAFPAAEWRRVETMKRNGFNAIRTSHNPPSTAFLDACDRLGVLVIDEFADCWELPKRTNGYSRYFAAHWEDDLRAMLRRDFNHPSVIVWSIGNEIQERAQPAGIELAKKLIACVRSIDSQRPITNAICGFWDNPEWRDQWDRTAPAFALLDIGGYNYMWAEYENDHAKFPQRVMAGTESNPREAYENWRLVEKHPYVIGDFVWTGMDHIGESGIGHTRYLAAGASHEWSFLMPWPTWINWSGDIDITGNKKPQSYYRDVVWGRSPVEICVHRPIPERMEDVPSQWGWPDELPSWTWRGLEGKTLSVRIFSRAPRVRLELNGRSLGERSIDADKGIAAVFEVPYTAGELKATALSAEGAVIGSRTLVTSDAAAKLVALPELDRVRAGREQLIYVPIEVRDRADRLVNDAEISLAASVEGEAELLGFGSANPASLDAVNTTTAHTFRGRALLILRSTGKAGSVRVSVTSPSLVAASAAFSVN